MIYAVPNFIIYRNPYLIIGGRDSKSSSAKTQENRTSLSLYDLVSGKLSRILILPSSGDTSYPGLVLEGDNLLISLF